MLRQSVPQQLSPPPPPPPPQPPGGRRQPAHKNDKLVWASRKNVVVIGVPDRGRRYLSDFYTTLIDIQWRWNLLFFVMGFVLTWLLFAAYYYLLCVLHGDLDPAHVGLNSSWTPCVENVQSFTAAYLFSIETMSTIGYGWRNQTEECPGVYLAVMVQSVIGAGLQFALASLVVSKTRRANRISQTILFSNTAVIYLEDGRLKLAVRIGDMRKGDVIGAHATGMLIRKTQGKSGHKVPVRMFTVPFEAEGGKQKLFLCWPCLLIHTVDQHSPFWTLSRDDLLHGMYELIVILDGVAATTSKPFQARKSYHAWEILWGHRFKALSISSGGLNSLGYVVNYTHFHHIIAISIPFCSAQVLERKRLLRELNAEYYDEYLNTMQLLETDIDRYLFGGDEDGTGDVSSQSDIDSNDWKLSEEEVEVHCEEDFDEHPEAEFSTSLPAKSEQTKTHTEAAECKPVETGYPQPTDTSQTDLAPPDQAKLDESSPDQHDPENTGTPTKDRVRKISRAELQSKTEESILEEHELKRTGTPTSERVRKISQEEFQSKTDAEPHKHQTSGTPATNRVRKISCVEFYSKSDEAISEQHELQTIGTPATERVRKISRVEFQPMPNEGSPEKEDPKPRGIPLKRVRKFSRVEFQNISDESIQERCESQTTGTPATERVRKISRVEFRNKSDENSPEENSTATTSLPSKDRVRKISRVEFHPLPFLKMTPSERRLSLGIPFKGTPSERRLSLGDALNMYRHRPSVTDTYLGTELPEEESDVSEARAAILSLTSQHYGRTDGRVEARGEVSRQRKRSTTQPLLFATETEKSS